jgi:hypothetical protein
VDNGSYLGVYRAMNEDNGLPKLGATATSLGIRRGKDIVPDQAGSVYRPAFKPRQPNGLSCSPSIQDLPRFALPIECGGINNNTAVWLLDPIDLGPDLVVQEDSVPGTTLRHLSIGPSITMSYDHYVKAIESTPSRWRKIAKP